MKYVKRKNLVIITILTLLAIIICMQSPLNFLSSGNSSTDSSVFKYIGMAMKRGQVPYRDTFDHKGVLLYFINYLGTLILNNRGVWILEVMSMIVSVLLAYKTLRLFADYYVSLISILIIFSYLSLYFQGGNLTEEWALPYIFCALYLFTKFLIFKNIRSLEIILCGITCGAVLMLRVNMIAIWIVNALVIIVLLIKQKQYFKVLKCIGFFLLGNVIMLLPMLCYLFLNNALYDFYEQYLVFNFSYSKVTWFEKWNAFLYFGNQPIFYLIFAVFIYLYFFKRKIFKSRFFVVISVGLSIIVNLILISISGRNYAHYGMIIIPTLLIPIGYLVKLTVTSIIHERKITNGGFIILYYCLSTIIIPNYLLCVNNIIDMKINNYNVDLANIIDEIETQTNKNDVISVFGNENILYCRTDRMAASKYSYQFPLIAVNKNIFDEYIVDIKRNRPKIIVISQMGGYNFEYYKEKLLKQVIIDSYEKIYKNDKERMEIYKLKNE